MSTPKHSLKLFLTPLCTWHKLWRESPNHLEFMLGFFIGFNDHIVLLFFFIVFVVSVPRSKSNLNINPNLSIVYQLFSPRLISLLFVYSIIFFVSSNCSVTSWFSFWSLLFHMQKQKQPKHLKSGVVDRFICECCWAFSVVVCVLLNNTKFVRYEIMFRLLNWWMILTFDTVLFGLIYFRKRFSFWWQFGVKLHSSKFSKFEFNHDN